MARGQPGAVNLIFSVGVDRILAGALFGRGIILDILADGAIEFGGGGFGMWIVVGIRVLVEFD